MDRRFGIRRVAFGVAVALAALFPAMAEAQSLQGYGVRVYRVESGLYPFVNAYFRTFDQELKPLVNLNAMNVGLMVKGKAYDPAKRQYVVQPLRQRSEAVRTVLVVDASKTMAGTPFEQSLQAAIRFIESKRPQDQVAILAIRDTAEGYELVSNWERDGAALARRLADVKCDGQKSRIYDTVAAAMQMAAMVGQESDGAKPENYPVSSSIVVFSDGNDEGSVLDKSEIQTRITSLETPIPIYSVAYSKLSPDHFKNLEALSKNSFGKYFLVGQVTDRMQRVVEEIQDILLGDYVVTFRAYQPVDGEKHAFKVGVEYPTGSGKYTYASSHFEALELPRIAGVREQVAALEGQLPKQTDPFMNAVSDPPPTGQP
jgi:Mg-chelatase subunit ChlD